MARERIARHVAELPKSGIRKFFDIVAQSKDVVSLGVGEPDFDTPWHISRAAVTCLENGGTHYTSNLGTPQLRQAISRYLSRRFGAEFAWESEILATVGVSEAIDLAIRALCSPGDEVLYHEPCFVSYPATVRLAHAVPVAVETSADDAFRLTAAALERRVTGRTKAVLLNFPCNPTGATLEPDEMRAILEVCERHDLVLLTDEVYSELVYDRDEEEVTKKRRRRMKKLRILILYYSDYYVGVIALVCLYAILQIKFGFALLMRCCVIGIIAFLWVGIITGTLSIVGKMSSDTAWTISKWAFYIGTAINIVEVLFHPFRAISQAWDAATDDSDSGSYSLCFPL